MRRNLEAADVVATLERLHARMAERFPGAGLTAVCKDLNEVSRTVSRRARRLGRPYLLLRAGVLAVAVGAAALQVWAFDFVQWERFKVGDDVADLTQALESAVNLLILGGAAVWFLLGIEERLKRRRALADLHELRSFAHVVDMHQLTKDPTITTGEGAPTAASPKRTMTGFELNRYLDYCAEMLSLIGKLAALYAEHTRDARLIAAVNDVEALSTDLARKIWQKITVLSVLEQDGAA